MKEFDLRTRGFVFKLVSMEIQFFKYFQILKKNFPETEKIE